jgi:hypothetical protein
MTNPSTTPMPPFRVSYDPVEDEISVVVSSAHPGIYVHEVDDGLYARIDPAGTVTHIGAERATLGRSPSWRKHLSDVASTGVLATLDAAAASGQPVLDRPLEVDLEELSRLNARWRTIAAEEFAGREAVLGLLRRTADNNSRASHPIAGITDAVRDRVIRLADSIGASFESLRTWGTVISPFPTFVEARTTALPRDVSLLVQVDRADELGVDPRGSLDLGETSGELILRVSGLNPSHRTLIAVLLDGAGVPVADAVLLAPNPVDLAAHLRLDRPAVGPDIRIVLFSLEQ